MERLSQGYYSLWPGPRPENSDHYTEQTYLRESKEYQTNNSDTLMNEIKHHDMCTQTKYSNKYNKISEIQTH